ncbi:MAG: hypothetical protein AABW81_00900 [Nanoarchaeota archaeon]
MDILVKQSNGHNKLVANNKELSDLIERCIIDLKKDTDIFLKVPIVTYGTKLVKKYSIGCRDNPSPVFTYCTFLKHPNLSPTLFILPNDISKR